MNEIPRNCQKLFKSKSFENRGSDEISMSNLHVKITGPILKGNGKSVLK
jgi:hypothetical protein